MSLKDPKTQPLTDVGERISQVSDVTPPPVTPSTSPRLDAPPSSGVMHDASPASHAPTIPPPASSPDPYVGTTFDGRYRVEAVVGEGGMGVVYLGRHKIIGKRVAIKVLRADMARDREITDRFLQEARAASSIGNPHIVDISDFGDLPDGSTYFVMEYLDGKSLGKTIEELRPMPTDRLIDIACQIADGLSAAHQRGIVHRDLKPDNVMITKRASDDFVKILDFGIAKVSSGTTKLTRAGAVFGTPHYMSPEQAAGSPVDLRTDIYALGVMLYEMASGRVPFDADNFMGILTQHMYKAPIPIRALVPPPPDVAPGVEAIILKALSKKPDQRYQTMDELAADLQKVKRGLIPEAVPEMMARSGGFNVPADFFSQRGMPTPVPAIPDGLGRRPRWGLFAGITGVLVAVGLVAAVFARSSSSTASSTFGSATTANPTALPTASPTASTPPQPVAAAVSVAPAAAAPEAISVMFASEPIDAHVFRAGQDLGTPPLTISVPTGKKIVVEVRHDGFRTQTISVDGSQPKLVVKLVPIPGRRPSRPASSPARPAQPGPAAPIGGGEIVNPWAK